MVVADPVKKPARAGARFVAHVAIIAGILLLTEAAVTLAWQEPVSAVLAERQQDRLETELDRRTAELALARREATSARARRALATRFARQLAVGDPVGRIDLPNEGRNYVVVQGRDSEMLRKGPGHYPHTALPGQGETVAIAGHRTTYLAPFRHIDGLKRGDSIALSTPYGRFEYRVERTKVVAPTEISVTQPAGYERLVLTACHPLYDAAKRIVVFARLRASAS